VIWFYEMKISYQLSALSISEMDIVVQWRMAFLCKVLPRHGMIVLMKARFPQDLVLTKQGILCASVNAWQSAAIPRICLRFYQSMLRRIYQLPSMIKYADEMLNKLMYAA